MATTIYDAGFVSLLDNTEIYITPLKIKFLRQFMEEFKFIKEVNTDMDLLEVLLKCTSIAMRQYRPSIKTIEELEDIIDVNIMYKILELSAGISFDKKDDAGVPDKTTVKESGPTWETLDLAKLESEVFLLGIWKDYEELESSLCMAELTAILDEKRENDYNEKKFLAAMQGVDLDKESGKNDPWEEMKARVFSGGQTSDPNDILSFQGVKAEDSGFGIGMGLEYSTDI